MKIKFLGAAGTVTGSSYILTSANGQSILIDLGMFQGIPQIDALNYEPYDFDCSSLIGAVLTHAHLDHCGRLPILLPQGFSGNIWMTPATRDLTELSLLDSANIAQHDGVHSLYDKELASQTIKRFRTVKYQTPFTIGDFTIVMRDAGHILGSASLEIVDSQANIHAEKIVFSGDLGNTPEPLAKATEYITSSDVVVMESTYGDRLHPNSDPAEKVQEEINIVEKSGSVLLIPAFSLERTQELLHIIKHLKANGKVNTTTPIYMDSPMAQKATTIYLQHPELFNNHIREELRSGSPFEFQGLEIIDRNRESQAIFEQNGPKVIIAGSGMMTGGRILRHASRYLGVPSTRLLIVGYQGDETIGRQLLDGAKEVVIDGITIPVRATISNTQTMSSHADQSQLMDWLKHIKNVNKIFLTHGDDVPRKKLAEKITTELGISHIIRPMLHEEFSF